MGKIKMLCACLVVVCSGYAGAENNKAAKETHASIALQAIPVKQEKTFYADDGSGNVYVITITKKPQSEIPKEERHNKTHGNIPLHRLFMELENQYVF